MVTVLPVAGLKRAPGRADERAERRRRRCCPGPTASGSAAPQPAGSCSTTRLTGGGRAEVDLEPLRERVVGALPVGAGVAVDRRSPATKPPLLAARRRRLAQRQVRRPAPAAAADDRLGRPDGGQRELALEHPAAVGGDAAGSSRTSRRVPSSSSARMPEPAGTQRRRLGGLGDLVALVVLVEHRHVEALRADPDHVVEVPPVEVAVAAGARRTGRRASRTAGSRCRGRCSRPGRATLTLV